MFGTAGIRQDAGRKDVIPSARLRENYDHVK